MTLEPMMPSAARRTSEHRVIAGPLVVGGPHVPVIGGPCAVETDFVDHAEAIAAAGVNGLRACIHKPRTQPHSFQGMGSAGLPLLDEAKRRTGLPILAEPLSAEHIDELRAHVDLLLIGARSMQNTPLLRAVGRSGMPVILKRALSATYDEWLGAADYILAEGNDQVILCERGIRTFETATRNTLDLSCIPVLRERTHLPIAVDPSHAAGNRNWVAALATAAVAAGADLLLIEAHPVPGDAWSDAAQAITPETMAAIVRATKLMAPLVRDWPVDDVQGCRAAIDAIDGALGQLLERRAGLVESVQRIKEERGIPSRDEHRETAIIDRVSALAPRIGRDQAARVMSTVIDACVAATQAARVT